MGKDSKMEQDFSGIVDKRLPELTDLALTQDRAAEALEQLFTLEKQTRNGGDQVSTSRVATAIIRICFERHDLKAVQENLFVLSKKRGQMKTVIQDIVKEAMTYLEKLPHDAKMELLNTLLQITEGKIFVELERARLTRILAKIRENEGKLDEAAEILQEVQVETFGAMEKLEKTDYILEQMRLCLDRRDYVRAQILSRKINVRVLNEKGFEELKIRYYQHMIRYYTHEKKWLDIARSYMAMAETPGIAEQPEQWHNFLKHAVVYVVLSPRDNEQHDLLQRLRVDKRLTGDDARLVPFQALLKFFATPELLRWGHIRQLYEAPFSELAFAEATATGTWTRDELWKELQRRVVEHNVRVIAGYYGRATLPHLAALLELGQPEAERAVADLVSSGAVYAKIDRPKGIVVFQRPKRPEERLNEWGASITELLERVEKTCHLIHREWMVHKVL